MPAKSPEALERKRQRRKERRRERIAARKVLPKVPRKRFVPPADKIIERRKLGPIPPMSKSELRAMLTAAVEATSRL